MNSGEPSVVVSGSFDKPRSATIRWLEEASKEGCLTVLLWSDDLVGRFEQRAPQFPQAEREYFLRSIRWVDQVVVTSSLPNPHSLPGERADSRLSWAVCQEQDHPAKRWFCEQRGIRYRVFSAQELSGFPAPGVKLEKCSRKKVVVTGCYDWLHSGHVRFFEEVSAYGDVYAVVGHDRNIRELKGTGHPLYGQEERRYMVSAIRFVTMALISSGEGWLDAAPEIEKIKPDYYAVNEEGDRGGKREYCRRLGIEYVVLKRTPAPGLPRRSSTELRGF